MRERLTIVISIVLLFASCDFGNSGEEEHLIGKYYVGWEDLKANSCIYIKETPESNDGQVIVSDYVFAIGNSNRYIIAKTLSGPKSTIEYYHIIDTKGFYHTNFNNNNYWEFSSLTEFQKKLAELNISTLEFNRNYPKDPW